MPLDSSGISTLDRICAILNTFNEDESILSLMDISRRIHLPKSTTHRLLDALAAQGLLNRDLYGRGYQLGYQLVRWGTLAHSTQDLRSLALPVLRQLRERTGETAILSVRYGHSGMWLEMIESDQPIRLAMKVGQRVMLHAGASAKVLWAFLSEAEIERILDEIELVPLRPNTITDRAQMRGELAAIRQQGYATSFEETDLGAMGVAAPVCDHTGLVVAGIGIAAPLSRIPSEKVPGIAPVVLAAGRDLSQRLGCPFSKMESRE